MNNIGIAIVGCGEISAHTVDAILKVPESRVTWVVDINREAAEDLAKRGNARPATDVGEALRDPDTQAVYVATPHFLHADYACRVAEAGKHVLVEKPFTLTDADGERVLKTCQKNRVNCATMFISRYTPHGILARKLVHGGMIGKVIAVHYTVMQDRREVYFSRGVSGKARPTDWRGVRAKSGGGNLIMNGSHAIDLIMWMTGLKPVRVYGEMGTYVHPIEVEDMLCATLRFDNGALGMAGAATAAIGKGSNLLTLFGDQGQIDIPDLWGEQIRLFTLKKDAPYEIDKWHSLKVETGVNSRLELVKDAVAAITEKRPFSVTGEDGVACQRVINAIYDSAMAHEPKTLSW